MRSRGAAEGGTGERLGRAARGAAPRRLTRCGARVGPAGAASLSSEARSVGAEEFGRRPWRRAWASGSLRVSRGKGLEVAEESGLGPGEAGAAGSWGRAGRGPRGEWQDSPRTGTLLPRSLVVVALPVPRPVAAWAVGGIVFWVVAYPAPVSAPAPSLPSLPPPPAHALPHSLPPSAPSRGRKGQEEDGGVAGPERSGSEAQHPPTPRWRRS